MGKGSGQRFGGRGREMCSGRNVGKRLGLRRELWGGRRGVKVGVGFWERIGKALRNGLGDESEKGWGREVGEYLGTFLENT